MISFSKAFISTILLLGGSFFIPGQAGAGDSSVQAPFNTGEIIERVSHHPKVEGDRIVIEDRAYEAEFKEGEAVLKAKQGKPGAEDVVIPVSGRPELRDGRVVYSSWEGEVEFEGHSQGLRYSERRAMPFGDSLVGRYSGNVARLLKDSTIYSEHGRERTRGTTTGEFLLDTNVVYVGEIDNHMNPSVAFDGTNYLVVWEDYRYSYCIFGARVNQSGVVLDPLGFAIAITTGDEISPSVIFDGVNYFVVWSTGDIYGARVSPGGIVLDPNGIAISTNPAWQGLAKVAFDGLNYLVVWEDARSGSYTDIYGARVTRSGVVLDTNGIAICTAIDYQWDPAVAFDGSDYLVVWSDARNQIDFDLYGARVTLGGVVIDTAGIVISASPSWEEKPAITFDGTNYFVVWSRGYLYGARVSPGGIVIDTNAILITTNGGGQSSIAFDGTNYLVVWNNPDNIYVGRVTPDGVVLDPNGIVVTTTGHTWVNAVAFGGTNYLVVWEASLNGLEWNIYGARVSPGGVVLDPNGKCVSTAANTQRNSSVASDGTNYLVVWEDWRCGSLWDIYGIRVSPWGVVLDSAAFPITTASNYEVNPAVAFDGTNYLVVWQDYRNNIYGEIYGARVTPSGVVLDPAGIAIADTIWDQLDPSVAFNGTNYLVVWEDSRRSNWYIFAARVSPAGVVLDPGGIAVYNGPRAPHITSVASDGSNYLAVWEEFWYEIGRVPYYSVRGARVNRNGVVLDTSGIDISTIAPGYATPTVDFDGSNYFVTWWTNRSGTYDIYGARVNQNGVVLDPNGIAICTATNSQQFPSVTFDGTNNFVVWQDYRNGFWDIYGAKVDTGGVVIDTIAISLQSGDQINPAIVHGGGDQVLVTYSGYTDSINSKPVKTMRIWGKFYPGPLGVSREVGIPGLGTNANLRVYPNPFREKAWVSANVPGRLKVYDALGRLVRQFPKEDAKPGPLVWDGRDERGRRLPGGVYFLRFEHGTGCETRKAVLLR